MTVKEAGDIWHNVVLRAKCFHKYLSMNSSYFLNRKQCHCWWHSKKKPNVCDTDVLLAHPLHRAAGKPSACQSDPQLKDVNASIFVEVQLVKQLSPSCLSVLVLTR